MIKEILKKYPRSILFGWALIIFTLFISLVLSLIGYFTPYLFVLLLPGLASLLFGLVNNKGKIRYNHGNQD